MRNCKIIEIRYGKELELSHKTFGFWEIQNNQSFIQSSVHLTDNFNNYLLEETYSSMSALAFKRSLNEHFLKQSLILTGKECILTDALK